MAKPEGPQASFIQEGAPAPLAPQDPPASLAPHAPQVPQALQQSVPHIPPLNGSHFKPKFSRKSGKDAEAHLLRTNDWMDTQISGQ